MDISSLQSLTARRHRRPRKSNMLWILVALSAASTATAQQLIAPPLQQPPRPQPSQQPGALVPDANGTIVVGGVQVSTTPPLYTDFDLFKNSGFFPCSTNGNLSADPTTKSFVVQKEVSTQNEFCQFMAGIPIMIPSTATQEAFFPWYPTTIAQALSLAVSYMGLFFTLRSVDRSRMLPNRQVPWHFWIQLPIDFARVVAFLFKTIHGFVDSSRFAWLNVLLWLLPLNYVYLFSQLQSSRSAYFEEPYAGAAQQMALYRSQQTGQFSFVDQGLQKEYKIKSPDSYDAPSNTFRGFSIPGERQNRSAKGAGVWTWIIITAVMWFFSFVAMILHWRWKFDAGTAFSHTYLEIETALLDPRTVATMPLTCLRFLQTDTLANNDFMTMSTDQLMFSLITTFQFLVSTAVLVAVFIGRREPFDRAYLVLWISGIVTVVMLLIPAFATGLTIVTKVLKQKQVISMRFTNDLAVTGGCTFAFVNMNKRLGYWNVPFELGFRIAMSFLGAS
ncbi:hypothetical protein BT63DRAFT_429345 [Microthyrium microscopicum]|uniref:TRP C-terminal domain-containing protein n=1 Tax=Microthyrium microscopicum TaxID=703497 RepID=A0A6A6TZ36_9PEZI|nr:hypothetical protein BT63DRAFT_429345 [Microthyrium microscopicum]